jgi:hypothetical protein
MKLQHVFVIKNTVALMLLNTFEMCCMGKPVFYVLFYVILRCFQGVINQFENEEGSDTILG